MRHRPRTTRTATRTGAALLAAAAATTAGLAATGPASASPTGLYAPSALVLTLSPGGGRDPAVNVARAVTLSCAPTPSGTHPAPDQACARLRETRGSFTALKGRQRFCPAIADPVTVTAEGVWQGRRVFYRQTYRNRCALLTARGAVFDF
jgi:hypothetical protein